MNMSTPPPEKTNPPAKTPGFGAALFGFWSTTKPSQPVASGTVPTPPVSRSPRNSHHRPMDISLKFPYEQYGQDGGAMTTIATTATRSHTASASAIDLLDVDHPTASPEAVQPFPSKSPWKSPPAASSPSPTFNVNVNANGIKGTNVRFSVGNLKAPPSATSTVVRSRILAGRRRYKPSTLLVSAKRRKTGPLNPVSAVNALQHSQHLFQPSTREVEARSNYTGFRAGKRLLGSSQRGGSRLVPSDPSNFDASMGTASDEEHTSPVEPATKRRKQVMFGADSSMDSKPVESEMMTPVRPAGPGFMKKKATPFKLSAATYADADAGAEPGPMVPSRGTALSLTPRPVVQLELETGDYRFEGPGEAEPLGPPVATRTPPFLEHTVLKSRDEPSAIIPWTFYHALATESKKATTPAPKTKPATPTTKGEATSEDSVPSSTSTSNPLMNTSGWAGFFGDQKTKWKCPSCFSHVDSSKSKCLACDAVRPGHEDKASANSGGAVASNASIGTGGFSFGGGVSFGSAPALSSSAPSNVGFIVGGGTSSSTSGGGFGFSGLPAASSNGESGRSTSGGGFQFGGLPAASNSGDNGGSTSGGGFNFGSTAAASSATAPARAEDSTSTTKEGGSSSTPTPGFSFGSAPPPAASTDNNEAGKHVGFAFASAPSPAPTNGEKQPFQFNVFGDEKKTEDGPKSTFVFPASSTSSGHSPDLQLPATGSSSSGTRPENDLNGSVPSVATNSSELKTDSSGEQQLSFGANASSSSSSGFVFGGRTSPQVAAPALAPSFTFGQQPSTRIENPSPLPPGTIPSKDEANVDRSKRQRRRDNEDTLAAPYFGGTASSAPSAPTPAFSFNGSAPAAAPTTFGSQPSTDTPAPPFGSQALAPAPGGFSFIAPAPAASTSMFRFESAPNGDTSHFSAPKFGSDPIDGAVAAAPAFGDPFNSAPAVPAPTPGFSFGGGSSSGSAGPSFGSTPAQATPATTFGVTSAPLGLPFGSGPTPAAVPPTFGSTPTPAAFGALPASSSVSFSTTSAGAPFGSTPAAPALPAFGAATTPAAFGAATTPAAFGATPVGSFGGGGFGGPAPVPTPAPFGGFGGAPAPALGGFGGGFGAPPVPQAPGGFGAPVAPGGFGGGGAAPQFSIGSSGGAASKTPGRRRILKARRPARPA